MEHYEVGRRSGRPTIQLISHFTPAYVLNLSFILESWEGFPAESTNTMTQAQNHLLTTFVTFPTAFLHQKHPSKSATTDRAFKQVCDVSRNESGWICYKWKGISESNRWKSLLCCYCQLSQKIHWQRKKSEMCDEKRADSDILSERVETSREHSQRRELDCLAFISNRADDIVFTPHRTRMLIYEWSKNSLKA